MTYLQNHKKFLRKQKKQMKRNKNTINHLNKHEQTLLIQKNLQVYEKTRNILQNPFKIKFK